MLYFSGRLNFILLFGGSKDLHITLKAEWLVLTLKRPSYQPIGAQILPRSVSEWGSAIRLGLFPLTRLLTLFTPSLLMEPSVQPIWVVIPGRRWLVLTPPCSKIARKKGSMPWVEKLTAGWESVSLQLTLTGATLIGLGSDSAWTDSEIPYHHVESEHLPVLIMGTNSLQHLDTSWFNRKELWFFFYHEEDKRIVI